MIKRTLLSLGIFTSIVSYTPTLQADKEVPKTIKVLEKHIWPQLQNKAEDLEEKYKENEGEFKLGGLAISGTAALYYGLKAGIGTIQDGSQAVKYIWDNCSNKEALKQIPALAIPRILWRTLDYGKAGVFGAISLYTVAHNHKLLDNTAAKLLKKIRL